MRNRKGRLCGAKLLPGVLETSGSRRKKGTRISRHIKKYILPSYIFLLTLGSCKEREQPTLQVFPVIEISTEMGNIYVSLYDETPVHKANFDSLTKARFYDSTEFHRCVDNFVIQGGSPTSKDENRNNDGSGGPGYTLPAEIDSSKFQHFYGALAAARNGNMTNPKRRSSGSQFYIVTNPEGAHFLDGEYTTFGKVLAGMDVAKTIESQPKNGSDLPNDRIKMTVAYVYFTQTQLDEKGIILL